MYVTSSHDAGMKHDHREAVERHARAHGRLLHLKAHAPLFFEGDRASRIFLVSEGALRVSKHLEDGRRQVLNFAFPGDAVGQTPDQVFHADCEALCDSRIYAMCRSHALHDSYSDPKLLAATLNLTMYEMIEMQEHFIMLGHKSAIERLSSFLVTLVARMGTRRTGMLCIDLPMTRSDIADFLGLTTESVSRCMTKLRRMGAITLPVPSRMCVLDLDKLIAASGARAEERRCAA